MTGPTDAPPPEDDGGADDDFLGELDDDMLLDALGQGGTEEGELGAMLGNWRDEVDSEPVPPIAERAQEIHDLDQQFDKPAAPPGPRQTSEGTPAPMAISEDAQRIRVVAGSQSAQGAIQLANTNLGEVQINAERLTDAVGVLQEAAEGVANDANTAASAAGSGEDEMALRGAGEQARQAFEAAMAAAEAARSLCDQAATAVQQALQVCGDAAAADQQFRQTCSDVAGRHGA